MISKSDTFLMWTPEMIEALPIVNAIMQYLVVPAILWSWMLHKKQNDLDKQLAVLKAQSEARETARLAEQEVMRDQLKQILSTVQHMSGRIDTALKER